MFSRAERRLGEDISVKGVLGIEGNQDVLPGMWARHSGSAIVKVQLPDQVTACIDDETQCQFAFIIRIQCRAHPLIHNSYGADFCFSCLPERNPRSIHGQQSYKDGMGARSHIVVVGRNTSN